MQRSSRNEKEAKKDGRRDHVKGSDKRKREVIKEKERSGEGGGGVRDRDRRSCLS